MAIRKQTYTRVLQCSLVSVGLAQARPNYISFPVRHDLKTALRVIRLHTGTISLVTHTLTFKDHRTVNHDLMTAAGQNVMMDM